MENNHITYEGVIIFTAIKIIKKHKLLNYVLKNPKCAKMYQLSAKELIILEKLIKMEGI